MFALRHPSNYRLVKRTKDRKLFRIDPCKKIPKGYKPEFTFIQWHAKIPTPAYIDYGKLHPVLWSLPRIY
jgi:hypothetical protein